MSFAFWAKVNTLTNWTRFIDWGSGSPQDNLVLIPSVGNSLCLGLVIGTQSNGKCSSYTVTTGAWNHYAFTFDSSGNFAVYVNGISIYSDGFGSSIPTTTRTHLYLGKSFWSNPYLNGAIKDFQFAAGAVFTAIDVQYLYQNVCPKPTGSSTCTQCACFYSSMSPFVI